VLQVTDLVKNFPIHRSDKVVHACDRISFSVERGEMLGVIGESGSGKTTLGRCVLRLIEPTSGSVKLNGIELTDLSSSGLRRLRSKMHIVFQEPSMSMNPQLTVGYQIAEPLRIHTKLNRSQRKSRVRDLLELVDLQPSFADAQPAALSGGELQRCSIARAIATNPDLVILDEPTSALPPHTEASVMELLAQLRAELGLTYVLISHNLSLVGHICDRIAVMYLGQIVEIGSRDQVIETPRHPYTRALLASILEPDPSQRDERFLRVQRLAGEIPSPIDLPHGCFLAARCHCAKDRCRTEPQLLEQIGEGHWVRCWRSASNDIHADEIAALALRVEGAPASTQDAIATRE
jgi:oligopeptide/dipeptide ABC transporter ATP-binding protein